MPACLLALLLAAAPHAKLAVLELEPGLGADPKLAHLITTLVTTELRKRPDAQVTSQQEIQTLLGFEKQKQLLNCGKTSCLAEIGGALGVDDIVTGSVAQLGDSLLVVLRLVEVRQARVQHEASRRLKNAEPDAVLDIIPGLVAELLGEAPPPAPAAVPAPAPAAAIEAPVEVHAAPARGHGPYWLMGVGAAVLLAGVAVTAIDFATARGPQAHGNVSQYALSEASASTDNTVAYTGDVAAGAGGALVISGLGWWLLQPRADAQ